MEKMFSFFSDDSYWQSVGFYKGDHIGQRKMARVGLLCTMPLKKRFVPCDQMLSWGFYLVNVELNSLLFLGTLKTMMEEY
jgi:hypothetical protein